MWLYAIIVVKVFLGWKISISGY